MRPPVVAPSDRVAREGVGPRTWAVMSAAGGIGRTTLTAVLGGRLLHRGRGVCLVDADWSGPVLQSLLGGGGAPLHAWAGALDPQPTREHDDLLLVSGPSPLLGEPDRAQRRSLGAAIDSLPADDVLLDLPAGGSDAAVELWLDTDRPILVAVPERRPLDATSRLLARVAMRMVLPLLARSVGAGRGRDLLTGAWLSCDGRAGRWLPTLAKLSGVPHDALLAQAGSTPLYLVLNRVRRGDDVDVGHDLVAAARDGLGLDLHFRGVVPHEEDAWIRARRSTPALPGHSTDLLGLEVDDFLERMEADVDVPPPGNWRWSLQEAAKAMAASGG